MREQELNRNIIQLREQSEGPIHLPAANFNDKIDEVSENVDGNCFVQNVIDIIERGVNDSVVNSIIASRIPEAELGESIENRSPFNEIVLAPNNETPERIEAGSAPTQTQNSPPYNASTTNDVSLSATIELDSSSSNSSEEMFEDATDVQIESQAVQIDTAVGGWKVALMLRIQERGPRGYKSCL